MEGRNRNNHGIYETLIRIRLEEIKSKIKVEKQKLKKELKKGKALKDEINELLLELNKIGIVKDVDAVYEFIDSIDEKYGLDDSCETELSRLYVEINDGFVSNDDFERIEDDEEGIENEEYTQGIEYTELLKRFNEAERRFVLCKTLFNRVELSNFEYTMLRDKLEAMRRENLDLSEIKKNDKLDKLDKLDRSDKSRLDDFCY